jgi:quinol monooxygenase YgiN
MSSAISLVFAGAGALTAAVGGGMLLARCFRAPRPDLIAWSLALIALLVSLGAQLLGYLSGYDAAIFRAMAIGGLVLAPLATALGLTEIASRGLAARFCARVYIAALAIVAVVILYSDQLGSTTFSKSWPNPHTYYQSPPNYILYAVSVVTLLITLIAAGVVMGRSGDRGWSRASTPQVAAGVAALMLAYPGIALLAKNEASQTLTLTPVFTPLLAIAAALIVWSGRALGQQDIRALHGGRPGTADTRGERDGRDLDRYPAERADGFDRFDDSGSYGNLYRPDPVPEKAGLGPPGPDDYAYGYGGRDRDGYGPADDWRPGGAPGGPAGAGGRFDDEYGGGYQTGNFEQSGYGRADFETGDFDLSAEPGGEAGPDPRGHGGPEADAGRYLAGAGQPPQPSRQDLFGQIAIYTLLEDRVHEFDQLTEHVVREVRGREPDTLVFIVHAVPSAPMQRILYEVYRDRAAFEWHREQPYVQDFEADRRPYVLATNVIELGLQQAKVSPFPSVAELFGEPGFDTSGFERPDYLRDYGRPPASHGDSRGGGGRW